MAVNCSIEGINCHQERNYSTISAVNDGSAVQGRRFISNEAKPILEICFHMTLLAMTSGFGIGTNAINILVYKRQGLQDSITLGFFALSISDIFVVLSTLVTAACYAAKAIFPDSPIDFVAVQFVTGSNLRNVAYSVSSVLTAFLSVERCCCVVVPFKVKLIFTKSRTSMILVLILLFHLVCYIPFIATQELRWKPEVSGNSTVVYRLKLHFSEARPTVARFIYILRGVITPTVTQVIVTVSVVILTNGLRASSRFRQAMKSGNNTKTDNAKDSQRTKTETKPKVGGGRGQGSVHGGLAQREARLVKAMILLVVIMSTSNVPLLVINYAQLFVPDLSIGRAYHNLISTCYSIIYNLGSVNASLNIFVYYHTSSKFKQIVNSLFNYSK